MNKVQTLRLIAQVIGVSYSFIIALTTYVHASFFESLGIHQHVLPVIYSSAGVFGIILVHIVSRTQIRTTHLLAILITLVTGALCILGFIQPDKISVGILLLVGVVIILSETIMYTLTDQIIERFSLNANTRSIRGYYLVVINMLWIGGPLLAATILRDSSTGFINVYAVAAIIGVCVTFVAYALLLCVQKWNISLQRQQKNTLEKTVSQKKSIITAYVLQLFLQFFYSVMIILTPWYLHTILGIPWTHVGILLAIALIAFPLIQFPLTRMKNFNIVPLIVGGLTVLALSMVFLAFNTSSGLLILGLLLVGTRVGAACIEFIVEYLFFRSVDERDRIGIAWYQSIKPGAYILGSLVAYVSMRSIGSIPYVFLIIGCIALFGALYFSISNSLNTQLNSL